MCDCATKLSDTVLPILHYFFDLRLPKQASAYAGWYIELWSGALLEDRTISQIGPDEMSLNINCWLVTLLYLCINFTQFTQ